MRPLTLVVLFLLSACTPTDTETELDTESVSDTDTYLDTDTDTDTELDTDTFLPFAPHADAANDEDASLVRLIDGTYRLVWFSDRGGNNDLWWASSADGVTWSDAAELVVHVENDHYPCLFQTADGTLHLAWQRITGIEFPNVYYQRSTNDGVTWSTEVALTTNTANLDWAPELFETSAGLHLLFSSDRGADRNLYVQPSADNGLTWGSPVAITASEQVDDFGQVHVDGNTIHLTWNRWTTDDPIPTFPDDSARVMHATSTDATTWSEAAFTEVTPSSSATDVFPTLFTGTGGVGVAWTSTATGDAYGDLVALYLSDVPATSSNVLPVTTAIAPDYTVRWAPGETQDTQLFAFTSDRTGNHDIYVLRTAL